MCCQGADVVYPASLSTSETELRKEPWSLIAQSLAFTLLSLLILTSHCSMPITNFELRGARNKPFGPLGDKPLTTVILKAEINRA